MRSATPSIRASTAPRAALPEPEEDEYYHADLIGLAAVLRDGSAFGQVRAVHEYGAGDSLEIERPDGRLVLVPFTEAAVPEVDMANGRLVIDPPEGLLENPAQREALSRAGDSGSSGNRESPHGASKAKT